MQFGWTFPLSAPLVFKTWTKIEMYIHVIYLPNIYLYKYPYAQWNNPEFHTFTLTTT